MKRSSRIRTQDRAPPGTRTQYHTVGVIGPKRKLRPDGTLLCEDVAIARTGTMLYAPGEVPLRPAMRDGAAQIINVTRDAATLFAPESMGSAIGAAITNDHPPSDVTPHNWNQLAKGFILDAWQGQDIEQDLMLADLVISDAGLIHMVNTNQTREVSLGYSADYEQTGDGTGRQRNIVINHLALVPKGRCGQRCAIGDRQPEEETMPRSNPGTGGARPRVRLTELAANLQELANAGEDDDDGVHVHLHMGDEQQGTRTRTTDGRDGDGDQHQTLDADLEERFSTIEEGMLELKTMLEAALSREGTPSGDKSGTGDSAALATSFQQFTAQAEILMPGFKAPTFDAATPRAKTVETMCGGRRNVLTMLGATTDGAALIAQVAEDAFDVATADCATVGSIFKSAAAVRAAMNNRTGDRMGVPNGVPSVLSMTGAPKVPSGDDINAANAKYWASRTGAQA